MAKENQMEIEALGESFERIFNANKEEKLETLIVISTIKDSEGVICALFGKGENLLNTLVSLGLSDKRYATLFVMAGEYIEKFSKDDEG